MTCINTQMLPLLTKKDPEAFAGFLFTEKFAHDLCEAKLTTHDSTNNWWDGFIGHMMIRNKEEIQAINAMYATRRDPNLQLQLNPNQISKLSTKAPVPIADVQQLLYFLRRIIKVCGLLLPRSSLLEVASAGYARLLDNGLHQKLGVVSRAFLQSQITLANHHLGAGSDVGARLFAGDVFEVQ